VAARRRKVAPLRPVSLLVLEGETEEIFYPLVAAKCLPGISLQYRLLRGQGNINKQVIGAAGQYLRNHPADLVRVYCCIDAETDKKSATPLDLDLIRRQIVARDLHAVLSVDAILADPEIESWFFHDIDGIYTFMGMQKSKRKPAKYRNAANFGKRDLQRLFEQSGRIYTSGKRARNFIETLNLDRILSRCSALAAGVELIKTRATDLTNHL